MTTAFTQNGLGRFSIVNGPSKFDLMSALFVGQSGTDKHAPVTFKTEDGQLIEVYINGVCREDGSGESWLFHGFISSINKVKVKYDRHKTNNISGWFGTCNRKGWFEYEIVE